MDSNRRWHCMFVVGGRPCFAKVAPVLRAVGGRGVIRTSLVLVTRRDRRERSADFLHDLEMGEPDYHLDVGPGSAAAEIASILAWFEDLLMPDRPDLVLVAGDVQATLAAALTAVKLHIPVAHLESGLRSRDRSMPGELNHMVTDSLSELLFASSASAVENVHAEGVPAGKVHLVGDTTIDGDAGERIAAIIVDWLEAR